MLGAGELGMTALRARAPRAADAGITVSVLLRPSTISSPDADEREEIAELRMLGVAVVPGDLAGASIPDLAQQFAPHDEVLSCIGFAAGGGTRLKLAKAALQAGVRRYVPWQFGVDYDALGRGSAQNLFDEQLDVRDNGDRVCRAAHAQRGRPPRRDTLGHCELADIVERAGRPMAREVWTVPTLERAFARPSCTPDRAGPLNER